MGDDSDFKSLSSRTVTLRSVIEALNVAVDSTSVAAFRLATTRTTATFDVQRKDGLQYKYTST